MEALDLAVGLWPVGAGAFVADAEVFANVSPGVRAVAGAVVGEDAFDGDALVGEPGCRAAQDTDGGFGAFISVHLDVGDAGVVLDDGVQVADPEPGLMASVAVHARHRMPIPRALRTTEEATPAAVGDVAELR